MTSRPPSSVAPARTMEPRNSGWVFIFGKVGKVDRVSKVGNVSEVGSVSKVCKVG